MTSKRALSQSTSALASSQSQPSSAHRPQKRSRIASPPSSSLPEPSTLLSIVPATPSQEPSVSHAPSASTSSAAADLPPLPAPSKRPHHPGSLRRLASSKQPTTPRSAAAGKKTRAASTLSGAKIGGKSKDLRDGVEREEMWVKRATGGTRHGLGFAGYLKKGVGAFVDRGCTSLSINAMGAAIPLALTLALAVRDAVPGGEPARLPGASAEGADEGEEEGGVVRMEVRTGSKVVRDEITPEDEDADLVYQSRIKSTVEIELSIAEPLASSLGQKGGERGRGGGSKRGGASGRGRKRRGGKK
ncbi:hypothetical protein JCM6882_001000 [Rhodosporidiobolus microsporus]